MVRLIAMNRRLFAHVQQIDTVYITRLALLCGAGLAVAIALLPRSSTLPLAWQTALAAVCAALAGALAWKIFRMRGIYADVRQRFTRRMA